ncbi:3-isopropylmalate dehydratase small subunit [Calidifontibacillus oryziterrae]|uniref:3-isopropylmalate dehydratase small subunit n=1 Tax=Calidifontibacillus oryziterrae TaxID=1191699 RepID=UPI00031291B9|nr:3-isopropylmalate dehydratase small subunit [Calidifontibacillus oryziterrae]
MELKGFSHVYGNNIDTDRIIPGKYTKTLNLQDLADHVLEDLDPEFRIRMKKGDIVVGGENFGCGSSREQAPLALKTAGVSAVIARSFARIFFRNAINIGLPVIEINNHTIIQDDEIEINLSKGHVQNLTQNKTHQVTQMPDVMVKILNEGGLVNYLKKFKNY